MAELKKLETEREVEVKEDEVLIKTKNTAVLSKEEFKKLHLEKTAEVTALRTQLDNAKVQLRRIGDIEMDKDTEKLLKQLKDIEKVQKKMELISKAKELDKAIVQTEKDAMLYSKYVVQK